MSQSEPHETLFKRLRSITKKVTAALRDEDTEALERLALEHNTVMNELNQAGLSQNMDLLGLVKELSDEVRVVIEEISKRRDEIGRQLVSSGRRKKVAYAYARNA